MMSNGPDHIIACDGGGSRCRIAITDAQANRLATTEGPSANPATSMAEAITCLRDTLRDAQRKAGLSDAEIKSADAWFGLAGVISPKIMSEIAGALPIDNITVSDDRPTNMAGAFGATDGYVAAIGTGSFLGSQNGVNQRFAGGWGFRLGDEASGAWLGRRLLSRILDWHDGIAEGSGLLEEVFNSLDQKPDQIVLFANSAAPADFASFAPQVVQAANRDDPVGITLMQDGARYIEDTATALGFSAGDALCLLGGVGPRYEPFLAADFTRNIVAPQGTALDGAIQLARGMAA